MTQKQELSGTSHCGSRRCHSAGPAYSTRHPLVLYRDETYSPYSSPQSRVVLNKLYGQHKNHVRILRQYRRVEKACSAASSRGRTPAFDVDSIPSRPHTTGDIQRRRCYNCSSDMQAEWNDPNWTPPPSWGNQDLLRPLSANTLTYCASKRIRELASPKLDRQAKEHVIRSCQWFPSNQAQNYVASERIKKLAMPKIDFSQYKNTEDEEVESEVAMEEKETVANQQKRPMSSPAKVKSSDGDEKIQDENRRMRTAATHKQKPSQEKRARTIASLARSIDQLSKPKPDPQGYVIDNHYFYEGFECPDYPPASRRLQQLATPKTRKEIHYKDPYWKVTDDALNANCPPIIDHLAVPKKVPVGYVPPKPVILPIAPAVLRYTANDCMKRLARPKTAIAPPQGKPDPFGVSRAALVAVPSQRILDLSKHKDSPED